MMSGHIFISHASEDDNFVAELRQTLEGLGLSVWVDSRNLRGGDKLHPEIARAIEEARQVIVVLSPQTVNSRWVRWEIRKALEVEKCRAGEGYRVIPLLLPGIEPSALGLWFNEEPLAVPVQLGPGGLAEALPEILAALGERLPTDREALQAVTPPPVADLVLELSDPRIETDAQGRRRATAIARLVYYPAEYGTRAVESPRYRFTAPLGPIEMGELRWYLERYALWPTGVFRERAKRVEAQLPEWGRALYEAALGVSGAGEALAAWQGAGDGVERRFSVKVESDLPEGSSVEEQTQAREAASELLSLPWELLHDGRGYLFHGRHSVRVRRQLPNRHPQPAVPTGLPIRVLLVSPRPEEEGTPYFDHRVSALPLVEALEQLGDLLELTMLTPPTFPALEEALRRAAEAGNPFHVVHFDGHGVYDPKLGLGALCFEHPQDVDKLEKRRMQLVHAEKLAEVFRGHRVSLVFLEACQTAKVEEDPTASVAAKLLEEGVSSVVAMSHSVLVETSRRFVAAFYRELAQGSTVGRAMLSGQQALHTDTFRGRVMAAGDLHLQDWFVPVLYQEERDLALVTLLPPEEVRRLEERRRRLRLGDLPEPPPHTFIGRSRELLALERLLERERYAVVRGVGGIGKTTLAAELARWLARTGRFQRAAFVSLEGHLGAREALDSLGRQLVPGYTVAQYDDLKAALQPVARALADEATVLVLDNLESVLPTAGEASPEAAGQVRELFALCRALLDAHPATRIVFTSREPLPPPFDDPRCDRPLGALSRDEAVKLVERVMAREGWAPPAADPGERPEEVTALVEAAQGHPRALVLLAREVARQGVRATAENLRAIMRALHERYPDDRERSLFASVELSLRRLPKEAREQVKALAVFHGGVHLGTLALMLDEHEKAAINLAKALVDVGLAEPMEYLYLRLDPALPAYLLGELSEKEREALRQRWGEAMAALTAFLYDQQFKDAHLAAQLTLLELPNLLALLDWAQEHMSPEQVVDLADSVEGLLAELGRPRALARASAIREAAARALQGEWSHARFLAEAAAIDRLLERGDLQGAHDAARALLQRARAAGEAAYPGAAYDIAEAHFRLGRVLKRMGAAEAALAPLAEAQKRFQRLADAGNTSAARMASVAIVERADCLTDLGRLEEAAAGYEEAIRRAEERDDRRSIATNKFQLGTVRMLQERYDEALALYAEAREIFQALNEPRSVAIIWHQMGMVYRRAGQYDRAEAAYKKSLAIEVRLKDRAGEASTLNELGTVYTLMGRLEEAVAFYRQAADIHVELGDRINEGRARSNLANTLIKLERYDDARRELKRAIECKEPFGHAAEPWKTWALLERLERAVGNPQAAARARGRAIESYLAYRRQGGVPRTPGGQLCAAVAQAIQQGQTGAAALALAQLLQDEDTPAYLKTLIPKLQSVLQGARDPALADDPALDYDDAAELRLLLEGLTADDTSAGEEHDADL